MVVKSDGSLCHKNFFDVIENFNSEDVLVLNETQVVPARFFGKTENGGKVEILLLNPEEVITKNGDCLWETLLKKKKRKEGML